MISPPTLAGLMADPGELDVTCLDCHHNTTMPSGRADNHAVGAGPAARRIGKGAAAVVAAAGQALTADGEP
jgi:hypothetical protein